MMTRKDYELIAEVLVERRTGPGVYGSAISESVRLLELDDLVEDFARKLAEDNPRFDRDRFIKAATLPDYRDH